MFSIPFSGLFKLLPLFRAFTTLEGTSARLRVVRELHEGNQGSIISEEEDRVNGSSPMMIQTFQNDTFFFPQKFTFSPQKSPFPQAPFLFPHLSNYCSDKNPNLS